ncbi:MAG: sodium/proline symporter [Halobacterium sp.]
MAGSGIAGGTSTWVLATFAVYLVVLVGIGLWASKLMETVEDYVIGGRNVGPVVTGFSERASEMSGWLALGVPGNAYSAGIIAFLNALGSIPADLLSWAGIAKRLRKFSEITNTVTIPTFFEARLQDDSGAVRVISSVALIIFEGGYVGAQIVAAGTLLQVVTGVEPWIGIVVGGVIVIGYTMLGGYLAVAWTDYIQGLIILLGFIVLPVLGYLRLGLPFGELAAIGSSYTSITGGASGWAALFGIISYAAIGLGWPGNPHIMVRFMGIDEVDNVRTAASVAQVFMIIAYVGAALVGLYALAIFGQAADLASNEVMPMLTIELLPGPIAGVILAAALAAMMSSADSQLLIASSAVVEDVYHGLLNQDASPETLKTYSQYATLGLGAASVTFAFLAKGTPVYTLVLSYAFGGLGAALGPTLVAALWWKRATAPGAVASMLVGTVSMLVWPHFPSLLGELEAGTFFAEFVNVYGLFPAFVLSSLVLVGVSLATQPPSEEDVDAAFDIFSMPIDAISEDTLEEHGFETRTQTPDELRHD